jgi:hypothetical protein
VNRNETRQIERVFQEAFGCALGPLLDLKIQQRGVQWKQGVVVDIMSCVISAHNTTPIHCTPFPLHPPLMNTQDRGLELRRRAKDCRLRTVGLRTVDDGM